MHSSTQTNAIRDDDYGSFSILDWGEDGCELVAIDTENNAKIITVKMDEDDVRSLYEDLGYMIENFPKGEDADEDEDGEKDEDADPEADDLVQQITRRVAGSL